MSKALRLRSTVGCLFTASPAEYGGVLLRATGSKGHYEKLHRLAESHNVSLPGTAAQGKSDRGSRTKSGSIHARSEEEIYQALGMSFIAPELREDAGEVEASLEGLLPKELVSEEDIKGMVHCHTTYSDGRNSVEEMAMEAELLGMRYITITDHSPTASYAGGVTLDRLKRQWEEIDRAQEKVGVKILKGTESDILADGLLDYPDSVLEQFDVIIASIHSRMKMDEEGMTKRLLVAMGHPSFKIWGHALGGLINRRPPFACRVEEVLDRIAQSRAAVEINGTPERLDMEPRWVREARKRGIRFVISTDAHSVAGLRNVRYGVTAARRGWVERGEVLNTLGAEEFSRAVRPSL